jgi:hypothetical protein
MQTNFLKKTEPRTAISANRNTKPLTKLTGLHAPAACCLLGLLLLLCPLAGMAQAPDLLVCDGKGFTITEATPADGTDITYGWFVNVNGEGFTMVPNETEETLHVDAKNAAGTYSYVRVIYSAECGPSGVASNTYTVAVLQPAPPEIVVPSSICSGPGNLQFTIPAAANTTYSWNKKEGTTNGTPSGDDNSTYTVTAPVAGTYTLTAAASVTYNVGDLEKVCVSPYATDVLAAAHPLPVVTPVGNTAFCGVGDHILQVQVTPAEGTTVAWYTESSGSATPVSTTTTYTPANLTAALSTWYVRATTANGCSNPSPLHAVSAKMHLLPGAIAGEEEGVSE